MVIIDEAQHLHPVLLEQLRLWSNLDGDGPPLLQVQTRDQRATHVLAVDIDTGLVSLALAPTIAWAAARRAIGTRNGEQLT